MELSPMLFSKSGCTAVPMAAEVQLAILDIAVVTP